MEEIQPPSPPPPPEHPRQPGPGPIQPQPAVPNPPQNPVIPDPALEPQQPPPEAQHPPKAANKWTCEKLVPTQMVCYILHPFLPPNIPTQCPCTQHYITGIFSHCCVSIYRCKYLNFAFRHQCKRCAGPRGRPDPRKRPVPRYQSTVSILHMTTY